MKKIVLLSVLLFTACTAFCQTFMHGAGVTVLVGTSTGSDVTVAEGVTYFPRFNFLSVPRIAQFQHRKIKFGLKYLFTVAYN